MLKLLAIALVLLGCAGCAAVIIEPFSASGMRRGAADGDIVLRRSGVLLPVAKTKPAEKNP